MTIDQFCPFQIKMVSRPMHLGKPACSMSQRSLPSFAFETFFKISFMLAMNVRSRVLQEGVENMIHIYFHSLKFCIIHTGDGDGGIIYLF